MGGIIAALALRAGLSERATKIGLGLALVALAILIAGLWLHFHDKGVVEADRTRSNLVVVQKNAAAAEQAADERLADQAAVTQQEKETHDAIHSVPDSAPDAARVRLGCERLRRAGKDIGRLAACSGFASGH
jgi:apolipoprotein N-acyltransferase